jgi:hypothetical protein
MPSGSRRFPPELVAPPAPAARHSRRHDAHHARRRALMRHGSRSEAENAWARSTRAPTPWTPIALRVPFDGRNTREYSRFLPCRTGNNPRSESVWRMRRMRRVVGLWLRLRRRPLYVVGRLPLLLARPMKTSCAFLLAAGIGCATLAKVTVSPAQDLIPIGHTLSPSCSVTQGACFSDSRSSSSTRIKVADDYCNTHCDQRFNYCQYRGGSLDDCVERLRVCRAAC